MPYQNRPISVASFLRGFEGLVCVPQVVVDKILLARTGTDVHGLVLVLDFQQ